MEKGHGEGRRKKKKASIATSSGEDKLVVRGRGRIEGKNEREEREGCFLFIRIKGVELSSRWSLSIPRGRKFAKDVRHPSTRNVHAFNSWKSVEETEEVVWYKKDGWKNFWYVVDRTKKGRRKFAPSLMRFVDNLIESNTGFGK